MPIYEYRCLACGTTFEKIQPPWAESFTKCPHCHDLAERIISKTTFILKGNWEGHPPRKEDEK
jgi:putative FmdB family regulatory protein